MMGSLRRVLGSQADLALVFLVLGILVVLFAPIPSGLLDVLILTNVSFALLLLLLTFYMPKPVEFSTFPALLLVATLFRLSLNIAATRLILTDADGGRVIGAIGSFVVGGNYVIGLIVFLILVVVQYVVVTSGAQRVSEVAARFTLDSMPGQQMSIDADLNMGFIDQQEAMRRRKLIEKEAGFYGAMDGASKFVKGDAVAGIIIMLINIIGGLVIGVMQQGMSWADALHTFTLLTIGDGIVTQIPALVISVGTGILVTRSASDGSLSAEVFRQIMAYPKSLMLVMVALFGLLMLPGIPFLPGLLVLAGLGLITMLARKEAPDAATEEIEAPAVGEAAGNESAYEALSQDPIEVRVGERLLPLVSQAASPFMDRINAFRKQHAQESGFVVPNIRFRDDRALQGGVYEIRIHGATAAKGVVHLGKTLAIHGGGELKKIDGIETRDPTYGLLAYWIEPEVREEARAARFTLVDAETTFLTHLFEVLRQQSAQLLTRSAVDHLISRVRKEQAGLVDELLPGVLTLSEVQKVLQGLLKEKVSIRNLDLILEVLIDAGRTVKDPAQLTELVRQRLAPIICQPLLSDAGLIQVLTLDPNVEQAIAKSLRTVNASTSLVLEPRFAEVLMGATVAQVDKMMKHSLVPVLLCAPELRRHLRTLTERVLPHLRIISLSEIPGNVGLRSYGTVQVPVQGT